MMTPYSDSPAPRCIKDLQKEIRVAERVVGLASSEQIRRDAEAILQKLKEELNVALFESV